MYDYFSVTQSIKNSYITIQSPGIKKNVTSPYFNSNCNASVLHN